MILPIKDYFLWLPRPERGREKEEEGRTYTTDHNTIGIIFGTPEVGFPFFGRLLPSSYVPSFSDIGTVVVLVTLVTVVKRYKNEERDILFY